MIAEGVQNGWSAIILTGSGMLSENNKSMFRDIPGTYEKANPISGSEGVRIVIHPSDTEPYPQTEGFDVAPGYSVSLGVKARTNIRIGPPHGNCSQNTPFGKDKYMYRLIACQKNACKSIL